MDDGMSKKSVKKFYTLDSFCSLSDNFNDKHVLKNKINKLVNNILNSMASVLEYIYQTKKNRNHEKIINFKPNFHFWNST